MGASVKGFRDESVDVVEKGEDLRHLLCDDHFLDRRWAVGHDSCK